MHLLDPLLSNSYPSINKLNFDRKLQLEIFKKSLNDKIYEYNHKLCQMRDKENLLRGKRENLRKLEQAYKDSLVGSNFDQGM